MMFSCGSAWSVSLSSMFQFKFLVTVTFFLPFPVEVCVSVVITTLLHHHYSSCFVGVMFLWEAKA